MAHRVDDVVALVVTGDGLLEEGCRLGPGLLEYFVAGVDPHDAGLARVLQCLFVYFSTIDVVWYGVPVAFVADLAWVVEHGWHVISNLSCIHRAVYEGLYYHRVAMEVLFSK